jgi:Leucine Rich repeat
MCSVNGNATSARNALRHSVVCAVRWRRDLRYCFVAVVLACGFHLNACSRHFKFYTYVHPPCLVILQIPDACIESLYPVEDNYVNVVVDDVKEGVKRSPKKLSDLCVDTICRSLPYMNGELPSGLPSDVVNDIVTSLMQHSALNAMTLRALRNCELNSLSLAGCRGVDDSWLEPLSHTSSTGSDRSGSNTSSPISCPTSTILSHLDMMDMMDPMELESTIMSRTYAASEPPNDVFYGAFEKHNGEQHVLRNWDDTTSTCIEEEEGDDDDVLLDEDHLSTGTTFVTAMDHHGAHFFNQDTSTYDAANMKEDQPIVDHSSICSVTMNMTLLDIRGSHGLSDRGLMQLMNLQSLEVARLDNCHSITGRGLLVFCHSNSLHTLSLANCRRVTDEAVINISHLLSLQALSLGGCRCITDRSLAAMADLYNLQKLDLSQCDLITDRGLQQLEHLSSLQELSLGWCRLVTDVGIDKVTSHHSRETNMRILRLARCPITDVGVDYLGRLLSLEELDLNGCSSIGSIALGAALEKMKCLTYLDVSYCPSIMYVL